MTDTHYIKCFLDLAGMEGVDFDALAKRISGTIDAINRTLGPGSILFGIQGDGRFHMTQEHKSPHYTTRWTELPKVSVK